MVRTMFQGTVPLSVNHAVGAMVFILMVLNGAVRTQVITTVERTTLATTPSVTMPLPSTDGQTEQTVYGSTPTETTNGTSVSEMSASGNSTIPMAPTEVDGTSVSGTGSMTTAEQVSGTSDVETSAPQISCFTCDTTNMTDTCYDEQSADQSKRTKCNAGESCWTFRLNKNGTFLNLTRACDPHLCNTMHGESDGATMCSDTNMIQNCTQCCKAELCNRHVNEGNSLSGCLSGVVLTVVAVLGMMQQ